MATKNTPHKVTKQDLENNPDLEANGIQEGEIIELPEGFDAHPIAKVCQESLASFRQTKNDHTLKAWHLSSAEERAEMVNFVETWVNEKKTNVVELKLDETEVALLTNIIDALTS